MGRGHCAFPGPSNTKRLQICGAGEGIGKLWEGQIARNSPILGDHSSVLKFPYSYKRHTSTHSQEEQVAR